MSNLIDDLTASLVDGLKNRTLTSCYRWAERRRVIQGVEKGNEQPAPYSARLHPWVVEMHNSKAAFNYAMKGAQLGVTEVAINRALYIIDKLKRDVLYVLPTSTTAGDFSKARFGGALSLSPYLKSLFTDTNAVNLKQAGANTLYIRGSRGDSNLVSIPVSELILDEVDRMEQKQIKLALERLSGKIEKHVWGISTPTIPDYGIHKLYMGSTQEHFVFPCPCCSKITELVWPDCVEIRGEHATDSRCHESYYKCKECGGRLEQADKPNFLKNAYWEPFDKNANPQVRGFHVNQLYSFTISPGELVSAYFDGMGNEYAQIEFHNSKLGLPFIANGARVDDEMLNAAVASPLGGNSLMGPRPKAPNRIITMGVDRGTWCHAEVAEWTFDKWGLDINANALCKVLFTTKFHEDHFDQTMNDLMRDWQILACVVDADPTRAVSRAFAKRYPGYVWLCQYRSGVTAKEMSIADEETGAPVVTVERANWMSLALSRFKNNPTRISLPIDIQQEYRDHIKALTSTYVKDALGNPVLDFVNTKPDHYAHARLYNEMALPLCGASQTNSDIKKFL